MWNKSLVISMLVAAIAVGPALAEEVIYFTNGTQMPIRSHRIEGDLIKVDLGDNGFMAFPASVVEKIEEANDVILMPSTGTNKMFTSESTSTQVFGASPRQASSSWALPAGASLSKKKGATSRQVGLRDWDPGAGSDLQVTDVPRLGGPKDLEERGESAPGSVKIPNHRMSRRLPGSSTIKKKD